MRISAKLYSGAALAATLASASVPAHAVSFAINSGPFTAPGNASGVLPSGVTASGTNTYDFTFSTLGGTFRTIMQMQATAVNDGSPQGLDFQLFRGPPGSGVWVSASGGMPTAATLMKSLAPDNYYLELNTSGVQNEYVTGGIALLSPAPEPAAWAGMVLGLGLLGLAARRRGGTAQL